MKMALSGVLRQICVPNRKSFVEISLISCQKIQNRQSQSWTPVYKPPPGKNGKSYRRFVHFEDQYTIKPLNVTNLAGRDPLTGRVVAHGIGGGIKHKYHWIQWVRDGPKDVNEPPKEELVMDVFEDGCRTCHIALVGCGKDLKYILATENMKPGQIIKTSCAIPTMAVRAFEGDAYPLGALPIGTIVNCVEKYPGKGAVLIHAAGTYGTILRKDGPDHVIIQVPSKREFSLDKMCMATIGRLSNVEHSSIPVGSAQRNRELGNRPRSGLWHRKTGRFGRKIKPPKPVRRFSFGMNPPVNEYCLFHPSFNTNADNVRKPNVPVAIPERNKW